MTFVTVCKTCMHDYDNLGCCAISVPFCLFISSVHCTKQDKLSSTLQKIFYHTASQAVRLYGKNLHSIAKLSSAILSHSEFLELWWHSTEPIAGIQKKHIFCYTEPHKLLVGSFTSDTDGNLCHSWSRWWPDSRCDECNKDVWCSSYCCFCCATSH